MFKTQIRTKVWLEQSGAFVFGEGGLDLLREIERVQSLTQAARNVGWSYRHAWGYLRNTERHLGSPLVETAAGKGATRGTKLTAVGFAILQQLGRVNLAVRGTASRQWIGAQVRHQKTSEA